MPIVDYEYTLAPLEALVPHEEVDPLRARRLALDIRARGAVVRPIIVDRPSMLVIDGHHRYNALMLLGARYAPVLLADYGSSISRIGSWRLSLRVGAEEAADHVERHSRRGPGLIRFKDARGEYVVRADPLDAYLAVGELLGAGGRGLSVVYRPPLKPYEVRLAASKGLLLPPKSTKHVTRLKNIIRPTPLRLLSL